MPNALSPLSKLIRFFYLFLGLLVALPIVAGTSWYIYWTYIAHDQLDYSHIEMNELVLGVLDRHQIPLRKNMGSMIIPTFQRNPFGPYYESVAGGGYILDFDTLEECGEICRFLLQNGYLDSVVPISHYRVSTGEKTSRFDSNKFRNDMDVQYGDDPHYIRYRTWIDSRPRRTTKDFDRSWFENSFGYCFEELLSKQNTLKVCTKLGAFTYAVVNGNWRNVSFGEMLYGGLFFGIFTVEGTVTWYQLIDYLKEKELERK